MPGGTVTYTVTVSNTGQTDAPGAVLDVLLDGVLDDAVYNGDAVASSGTLAYAAPRLTWTVAPDGPDHATVVFAGRFDAVEAMAARARMAEPDVTGPAHLVLDLYGVTFLDSAGLAVLVRARQDRQRDGRTIALVRPESEDAMRVLRLTQFDQIFTVLDRRPPDGD